MNAAQRRSTYTTVQQKRKLIQFITKHPELIACKVTSSFTHKDSQRLWQSISNECNALPGAKKGWRQWRKTFQDLRSKAKKKQRELNGDLPQSAEMLTTAEQVVLGLKNIQSGNDEDSVDEAELKQQDILIENNESTEADMDYDEPQETIEEPQETIEEPQSPPEIKVFDIQRTQRKVVANNTYSKNNYYTYKPPQESLGPKVPKKHSNNNCLMNCDVLASQEQHKITIKEDYLNFKKEYLKQKLKFMKEQTEALKSIANQFLQK